MTGIAASGGIAGVGIWLTWKSIEPGTVADWDGEYCGDLVFTAPGVSYVKELPPRHIGGEGEVSIDHNYRGDEHGPAHAHVTGGGPPTRIGANGNPLAGDPELTRQQRKVVEANRSKVRKTLKTVGRWLQEREAEQQRQQEAKEQEKKEKQ